MLFSKGKCEIVDMVIRSVRRHFLPWDSLQDRRLCVFWFLGRMPSCILGCFGVVVVVLLVRSEKKRGW